MINFCALVHRPAKISLFLQFFKKNSRRAKKSLRQTHYNSMQFIRQSERRNTSITLTPRCKRRLLAAQIILARNGVIMSQSDILSHLIMLYLQAWRGKGLKSATLRRKNVQYKKKKIRYVQVSFYVDKVLYSVLWERAIHSGMSVSRMMEFAMRYYMRELMERTLRTPARGCKRAEVNWRYWAKRYEQRKRPKPKVFIIYQAKTMRNSSGRLKYHLKYEICPFERLWQGPLPPGYAFVHW